MPRYIDADALISRLEEYSEVNKDNWYGIGFKNAITVVEDSPTDDVVEVVRCKDCSWWQLKRIRRKFDPLFECVLYGKPTTPEFYCASGEKRSE